MKNYTFIESKYIDEIESKVSIYRHNKSGARICTMENDDDNKVFSIAFRTPPINNSGLTHILEHSVLCGSKKYPVKDPFVELLKSSLNTFLNAFTFPDKTMYPVASLNLKDFKNLMSVYMDAVFYPNIYEHKEIFYQEGWHYHLENKDDPITYNGVVYNEMRGAFSDPQSILQRQIMHSLFKDTAYGLESGGDPKYIPDLDYEQFLKFHSEYYSPSNSYIYIYGNCDMEERMEWLDKEYLSKFDKIDFDTTLKYQKPFDKPIFDTSYYQTEGELKDKTFLSYNIAVGSVLDVKKVEAIEIIVDSLFNIPGAKLKEKLQNEGIATDIDAYFETDVLEPFISITATGSNPECEEKFIKIIDEEFNNIVNNGLDKDTILSLINHAEFDNRERSFSNRMPKGLLIIMSALTTYLYDDNSPFSALETIKYFKEFKDDIDKGYFENIIKESFINNTHKSFVKLIPSLDSMKKEDDELAIKLDNYKKTLSDKEIDELIEMNKKLIEYQNEESKEEDINKLPKLNKEDLDIKPEDYKLELKNGIYHSNYHTNGITYLSYSFDYENIAQDDLLILALYLDLFKQISTKNYSYFKINQMCINELGSLFCEIVPYYNSDNNINKVLVSFKISALDPNMKIGNDLLIELINNQNFNDTERLYQRLLEIKNINQLSISDKGHSVAINRAYSFINKNAYDKDSINGIGYLDFINNLVDNFKELKDDIVKKLFNVKNMLGKDNLISHITGNDESFNSSLELINEFKNILNDKCNYNKMEFIPNPHKEAIMAPYNVNYCAKVGIFNDDYTSESRVLENALSKDYLWLNVRVHGGAYGCMLDVNNSKILGFTSYRDPNIDKTIKAYDDIVKYIKEFNPSEDDLLKYKIGALANSQIVVHNKVKGSIALKLMLSGRTYEMRCKDILNIINAKNEDLNKLLSYYEDALKTNSICVLGNKEKIEKSKIKFDVTRNLIK